MLSLKIDLKPLHIYKRLIYSKDKCDQARNYKIFLKKISFFGGGGGELLEVKVLLYPALCFEHEVPVCNVNQHSHHMLLKRKK